MTCFHNREACTSCGGKVSRCSRSGLCRTCYIRPLPADFRELAATMRQVDLIKHYGVAETTVNRWYAETGLSTPPRLLPAPDDLAANVSRMGVMQLARHYGRGDRTVRRWLKEKGLKALASPPRPRSDYKPRAPRKSAPAPFIWKRPNPTRVPPRDTSLHGSAADHLRRYAAVYRCSERGRADPNGEYYRYGLTILNPDELLQRAQSKGWEAFA